MDQNTVQNDSKQYIVVKLDDEQYGIEIGYVDNIVRFQKPTRVPKTQPYFMGVINLRGEIVPVMSLRLKFDLDMTEPTNATRIIIIKTEQNAKLGIVVDEVREVVTLSEEDVEKPSFDTGVDEPSTLIGVGKYGETLISLLNIGSLLNDIDND